MRRLLSIFVLCALLVPAALPVFAGAPQDPHACCRRAAHRCHMGAPKGPGYSNRVAICRCSPRTQAAFAPAAQRPSGLILRLETLASQATPQVVSHRTRPRGGRAPPASLLLG